MSMFESSASNLATKVYNTRTAIHSSQQHVSWCPCPTAHQTVLPPVKRFQKQSKPCSCGTSHIGNCPAGRMTPEFHLALMWQNPDCLLLQRVSQQDGVIWIVPVMAIVPNTSAYQAPHFGCSRLNIHLLLSALRLPAGKQHGHLKHAE